MGRNPAPPPTGQRSRRGPHTPRRAQGPEAARHANWPIPPPGRPALPVPPAPMCARQLASSPAPFPSPARPAPPSPCSPSLAPSPRRPLLAPSHRPPAPSRSGPSPRPHHRGRAPCGRPSTAAHRPPLIPTPCPPHPWRMELALSACLRGTPARKDGCRGRPVPEPVPLRPHPPASVLCTPHQCPAEGCRALLGAWADRPGALPTDPPRSSGAQSCRQRLRGPNAAAGGRFRAARQQDGDSPIQSGRIRLAPCMGRKGTWPWGAVRRPSTGEFAPARPAGQLPAGCPRPDRRQPIGQLASG